MHCTLCRSSNQAEFAAEMMIHFSGLRNVDYPGILAFPKVVVCLDCGLSQFTVSKDELALLASPTPTSGRRPPSNGRVENVAHRVA
jgi:hypothetical protein